MYFKIYWQFFKTSFTRLLIYRKNFWVHTFTSIMWVIYFIFSIEIVFRHTESIRGWGRGEVLLIVATLFFIDGLRILLFYDNLKYLPSEITEGNLDLILTKPIDAQFLLSLRRVNLTEFNMFVFGGLLWWYAFSLMDIKLSLVNLLIYILLVICGLLIVYSLWFMLVTCSFWYMRIDNVSDLFSRILDIGKYPADIFRGLLKIIVFTVVPLGVITNFPVQAVLGSLTIINLLYGLMLTGAFVLAARLFWRLAVKNYTSASS